MVDWEEKFRRITCEPWFTQIGTIYAKFMEIERGSKFPFYINSSVRNLHKNENTLLDFIDNLVDIHEFERNKDDTARRFYDRLYYVMMNIPRHQNDTMANLTFDVKLPKYQYDKLNNAIAVRYTSYLASMTILHTMSFAWLCYFFRYRKLTIIP